MQKSILGIDIGSFNIKIVESIDNGGRIEILNYAIARTPDNSINDGKITDLEKVAAAVNDLLKHNYFKSKDAICLLSSSALVTREVNVPKMGLSDLDKYVQVDSQQYFPVNLEEYILDYKILGEMNSKDGSEYVLLLAAIPSVITEEYVKLFNKLKIKLQSIDIIPSSIQRYAAGYLNKQNSNTVAVVDLGADSTYVNIITKGVLEFSRMIPHGSNDITKAIGNAFNLNYNEAEDYKLQNAQITLEAYGTENFTQNISDTIKPILDTLASNINKFFEYYYSRSTANKINTIYLIGGGSLLNGLDEYFRTAFNIAAKRVSPTDGIVIKSSKPTIQKDLAIILDAYSVTFREW